MKRAGYFEGKLADLSVSAEIFRETVFLDLETPIGIFLRLQPYSSFILESAEKKTAFGRYSFIGGVNLLKAVFRKGNLTVRAKNRKHTFYSPDPLHILADLSQIRGSLYEDIRGFFGGLVGYLSYDSYAYFEQTLKNNGLIGDLPESCFVMPGFVISYDHYSHISNIYLTKLKIDGEEVNPIDPKDLSGLIKGKSMKKSGTEEERSSIIPEAYSRPVSSFTKAGFVKAVEKALEYIYSGDAYQVVLSQRFSYPRIISPLMLYRYLRINNPSPYMFYFPAEETVLVGASPEPLLRVEDGLALTRPIAGTRPRGKTDLEDGNLEKDLLSDEKELAEHTMLVDLARNDIGRVAEKGTVRLTKMFEVERYSHVMHIVSEVVGKLEEGRTAVDALKAVFPAGTVSGAPKIRAAQIISELEPLPRGIYAGALGYLNFKGDLDTCIAIRTSVFDRKWIHVQAGAGIVRDSVPENEYQETVNKAKGILEVLEKGVMKFAYTNR
jgi:anthranilate synthase component 1